MPVKLPERQRSLTTELAISRGLGSSPTSNFLEPEAEGNWHEKDVCPTNALLASLLENRGGLNIEYLKSKNLIEN